LETIHEIKGKAFGVKEMNKETVIVLVFVVIILSFIGWYLGGLVKKERQVQWSCVEYGRCCYSDSGDLIACSPSCEDNPRQECVIQKRIGSFYDCNEVRK